uniref:(California timema) hypothetical protein n=1 Tax=Timema californicum TaxID=61474 RepID=A0A7R9PBW0_TIMCA|nr:unnamed protein product [Timema californicum]
MLRFQAKEFGRYGDESVRGMRDWIAEDGEIEVRISVSSSDGACAKCSQPAKSRCSSCEKVYYCSLEHQLQHWPEHERECDTYKVLVREHVGRWVSLYYITVKPGLRYNTRFSSENMSGVEPGLRYIQGSRPRTCREVGEPLLYHSKSPGYATYKVLVREHVGSPSMVVIPTCFCPDIFGYLMEAIIKVWGMGETNMTDLCDSSIVRGYTRFRTRPITFPNLQSCLLSPQGVSLKKITDANFSLDLGLMCAALQELHELSEALETINWDQQYGVASRDLEAGKVVFTESPVAVGPKVDSPPLCLGCYAFVDGSSLCTLCGWPVCGPQCQDSPQHATNECPIFKEAGVKFQSVEDFNIPSPQYECIAPLRALLSRESNLARWNAEVTAMEAHNSKRRETDVWGVNQVNTVDFLRKQCKLAESQIQLTIILQTPFNDLSNYSSRASHELPSTT